MILQARFVVPVDSPPIEGGAVVVEHGRITAVGRASDLRGTDALDYGDAVITPGFVNAHTHLELSSLAHQVPPTPDFIDWLRRLIAAMPPTTSNPSEQKENIQTAVRTGVALSLAAGVTTIGDITRHPHWTREILAASEVRGVSFGEITAIGRGRHLLGERLASAASTEYQTERLRVGLSPHAPYSVEPDAMRACAERARVLALPLCIHAAETADEEEFTSRREGRFVDFLGELGVWDEEIRAAGCGSVELCRLTGLLGPRTVLAHANYVSDGEITQVANHGASVAYCPRTHHAFHHPAHRFRDMLEAGVNVCIATDSLASNPSLSILDELRFLRNAHRSLPSLELLAMGTRRGAQALGFADTVGTLTVGKAADLVVIPLDPSQRIDAWDQILTSAAQPIQVYVDGVPHLGTIDAATDQR